MPNYDSLDTLHRLESKLSNTQYHKFRRELNSLVNPDNHSIPPTRDLISAPASQRRVALLRAIGKWGSISDDADWEFDINDDDLDSDLPF